MTPHTDRFTRGRDAEWTNVTRPLTAEGERDIPVGPPLKDYRTPECRHGFSNDWGKKGERQRLCRRCRRWVWDHEWDRFTLDQRERQ